MTDEEYRKEMERLSVQQAALAEVPALRARIAELEAALKEVLESYSELIRISSGVDCLPGEREWKAEARFVAAYDNAERVLAGGAEGGGGRGMSQLFQIYEDDLAELERLLPSLGMALTSVLDNKAKVQLRRCKAILSNVRWDYGPPDEIESVSKTEPEGGRE